jgi:hypothetical protein
LEELVSLSQLLELSSDEGPHGFHGSLEELVSLSQLLELSSDGGYHGILDELL